MMAKSVQSGFAPIIGRGHAQLLSRTGKPGSQGFITQGLSSFGRKKGRLSTSVSYPCAQGGVVPELFCRRRMQWHNPRPSKFAFPNLKSWRMWIELNVSSCEPNRFPNTDSGTRHQSEDRFVCMRAQGARGADSQSCFEKIADLVVREKIRNASGR